MQEDHIFCQLYAYIYVDIYDHQLRVLLLFACMFAVLDVHISRLEMSKLTLAWHTNSCTQHDVDYTYLEVDDHTQKMHFM